METEFKAVASARLISHLAAEPLKRSISRRLLGKPYILYSDLLNVSWSMYETGAIIGRARRQRLRLLMQLLFTKPNMNTSERVIQWMQADAQSRWEHFNKAFGREPENFIELISDAELAKAGFNPAKPNSKLQAELKRKLPITQEIPDSVVTMGVKGIGFGSCFPELTVTLYRDRHYRLGERLSFEAREAQILEEMTLFIAEYSPDLLNPLGLKMVKGKVTHAFDS
ncbi:MAG: hypothetical protein PHV74_04295 [Dehalococcoidia bacterium]|nr:hypothetical protein [Dehalococcoidia bacterium]